MMKHISVLLQESISSLNLKENSIVVDATLGYGGHSSNILERVNKGYLFAFDQDSEAIRYSTDRLNKIGTNFTIIKSNFVNMKEELNKRDINKVDAVLFDLGVSSPQLDDESRGFSFHNDARLDMRMDREQKLSAYEVVNEYSEQDLSRIFYKYGEDKFSKSIARKIVEYRKNKPIETTLELVEVIKSGVPMKYRINKHPARQIFQAIRIEVNHELDVIEPALSQALELLRVGGRVAVITFHSLEDRLVKNYFKEKTKVDDKVKGMPNIPDEYLPDFKLVVNKAIIPSEEEIENNPRARSSKLRVIERIK
ncbi:MAG: 16S rRNA (cytosine(1402)-N(4))-methyltransferase RsmH [Mollicutes bacterium]|nr:16S rRNA (cytosine(1402)-N(4))-methyltransferase RsmH [Mollicutes bacterium]MDY5874579.1 16S rRNA (cytosine(1402)-N(4))-methyltransferase RsmH [Bacilli bacterium]